MGIGQVDKTGDRHMLRDPDFTIPGQGLNLV